MAFFNDPLTGCCFYSKIHVSKQITMRVCAHTRVHVYVCVHVHMLYIHQCRGQRSTDHLILLRPLTELGDRLADTEPL